MSKLTDDEEAELMAACVKLKFALCRLTADHEDSGIKICLPKRGLDAVVSMGLRFGMVNPDDIPRQSVRCLGIVWERP